MQPINPAVGSLSIEHAEAIQKMVSHPDIALATRIPHPYPENGARLFIEMSRMEREIGKSYHQVILNNKTVVGVCGLMNIISGECAELGYWIGRSYWGKGFASFAVEMILPVAFEHLQLQRVYATVLEFNKASMRVLEKNGFSFQRKEPHHSLKWSPDVQLQVYEITKDTWKNHYR
jgi:RimJ/RimL family protein N-acetyltransferase